MPVNQGRHLRSTILPTQRIRFVFGTPPWRKDLWLAKRRTLLWHTSFSCCHLAARLALEAEGRGMTAFFGVGENAGIRSGPPAQSAPGTRHPFPSVWTWTATPEDRDFEAATFREDQHHMMRMLCSRPWRLSKMQR